MTAADSIKALETKVAAIRLTRRALVGIGVLLVLTATWCAGSQHGHAAEQQTAFAARQDTIRDTIRVSAIRVVHDTIRQRVAIVRADSAVQRFDSAAARLVAIADTSTSHAVPVADALPPITLCQTALAAKDSVIAASTTAFLDLSVHDHAETQRADLVSAQLATMKPPRFGLKTGLMLGALAAVAAHLALK